MYPKTLFLLIKAPRLVGFVFSVFRGLWPLGSEFGSGLKASGLGLGFEDV